MVDVSIFKEQIFPVIVAPVIHDRVAPSLFTMLHDVYIMLHGLIIALVKYYVVSMLTY